MNFEYYFNDNNKIDDNYKAPNTDRYSCHYFYENKENIDKSNILNENHNKENKINNSDEVVINQTK